jgi:hypothetical protein
MRFLLLLAAAIVVALFVANNAHAAPLSEGLAGLDTARYAMRWAPMLLGFGGAGVMLRRRRNSF